MNINIDKLAADQKKWHDEAMPLETPKQVLIHLHKEVVELQEAVVLTDQIEEAADVLLCLLAWINRRGVSPYALLYEAKRKLRVNQQRNWIRTADGDYRHLDP